VENPRHKNSTKRLKKSKRPEIGQFSVGNWPISIPLRKNITLRENPQHQKSLYYTQTKSIFKNYPPVKKYFSSTVYVRNPTAKCHVKNEIFSSFRLHPSSVNLSTIHKQYKVPKCHIDFKYFYFLYKNYYYKIALW